MGMKSRRKGKTGERELALVFIAEGFAARTGRQHRGGPDSPDVIVDDLPRLHVECKRTEKFSLYSALDQAAADAGEDQMPVVCHRRNSHRWVAVLDFEDFAKLLREYAEELQ